MSGCFAWHSLDDVVGYLVTPAWDRSRSVYVGGACSYPQALERLHGFREGGRRACVEHVYGCCSSTLDSTYVAAADPSVT